MKERMEFRLNGKGVNLTVDTDRMLLWVLREELGLTGNKYGCGEGVCGACTVLVVEARGDLEQGTKLSAMVVEGTYLVPYVAHAPLEQHTATVKIEDNVTTAWGSPPSAPSAIRTRWRRSWAFPGKKCAS